MLADAIDRAQPALETVADETRTRLRDFRIAARKPTGRDRAPLSHDLIV